MYDGSDSKSSMIGGSEVQANPANMNKHAIHNTNLSFWNTRGSDLLGETALPYYGAFLSEEKCRLFGEISGARVLEIGCGSGQSLKYLGERNAAELWGLDISPNQIEKTRQLLASCGLSATLVCSPMEEACGIPENYFDIVFSIYAIGWTTDLDTTFRRIALYLKKDGVFIFSWSHPIHKCVAVEQDRLIFKKSYFDESWYSVTLGDSTLTLSDRKMSTYVNALAKAGFVIEQLVEESDEEMMQAKNNEFSRKARMLPVTFVIKARKR